MKQTDEQPGKSLKRLYVYAVIAALLLLFSGWAYRKEAQRLHAFGRVKVLPEISFKYFPRTIDGWEGRDQPISDTVLRIAANDDYVCRNYRNVEKQLNASLYIAYTCEPMRMLGHRPQICYPANGWILEATDTDHLTMANAVDTPVLIHRFYKPGLADEHIVVLNYYIVNGTVTADHAAISGLKWRRRRMPSGQPSYVAQVQISSDGAAAAHELAQTLADQILFHLPKGQNKSGTVKDDAAVITLK